MEDLGRGRNQKRKENRKVEEVRERMKENETEDLYVKVGRHTELLGGGGSRKNV